MNLVSRAAVAAVIMLTSAGCSVADEPEADAAATSAAAQPSDTEQVSDAGEPAEVVEAPALSRKETAFLAVIRDKFAWTEFVEDEPLLKYGRAACRDFDKGWILVEWVEPKKKKGDMTIREQAFIAGAAVTAFCPRNEDALTAEPEPELTVSQENAIGKAQEYLDYTSFSWEGLVKQLEFEGFSRQDAEFGANNVAVNWRNQAAKKAREYLDYSSFSRQGLIDQLVFEGFTYEQAVHGVNQTGLR